MKYLNIKSLFFDAGTTSTLKLIRAHSPHRLTSWSQNVNGKLIQTPHYVFSSPVAVIRKAVVCQGRYPLDVDGNLWVGGVRYFQRGLEMNGVVGEVAASTEHIRSVIADCNLPSLPSYNNCVLIGGRDNFGHFLFEFLPKFYACRDLFNTEVTFLVSSDVPPRFLDFAELLGIPRKQIQYFESGTSFRAETLIVPSVSSHRHPQDNLPCVDSAAIVAMVKALKVAALPATELRYADRILYVSRQRERWRRVRNEIEIFNSISRYGNAVMIDPKDLSAAEQIAAFHSARAVVMPIGGASPTVMFCSPNSRVIELSTPSISGIFGSFVWSALFNLDYFRVDGRYDQDCRNDGSLAVDRDFIIHPQDLGISLSALR